MILSLIAGCVHHDTVMTPGEVAQMHDELASGRTVTAHAASGRELTLRFDTSVEATSVSGLRTTLPISQLFVPCPEGATSATPCVRGDVDSVVIDRDRALSTGGKLAIGGVLVGAAIGGLIYCAIQCGSPGSYVADGGLVVVGIGAAAAALIVALLVHSGPVY